VRHRFVNEAVCTNTMHKVADAIAAAIEVPFVHIADTTAVELALVPA
jgi:aspartate racemase